jgi:hypothetical protein
MDRFPKSRGSFSFPGEKIISILSADGIQGTYSNLMPVADPSPIMNQNNLHIAVSLFLNLHGRQCQILCDDVLIRAH